MTPSGLLVPSLTMLPMRYTDTRGLANGLQFDDVRAGGAAALAGPAFTDVLIKGLAPGGGLFVPESVPALTLEEILALAGLPYATRAARIFAKWKLDLPSETVETLLAEAYGDNFDVSEVAPLREVRPGMHVLELWHGPTAAFKDMALQVMPRLFGAALEARAEPGASIPDYLVLVATSGDTGKAALEGFAGRPHTRIAVFYPRQGVSELQRRQMVTQGGANVAVFGVEGNFDDCQSAVKAAFNDPDFNAQLLRRHNVKLTSANSINWGRLLPQVIYYVSAYADLAASGAVSAGEAVDFCVPTGNFGNILAGYYAKRMGVPIARLICASNENRVLADFLETGIYDLSGRVFVNTPSPSMDILISSNLERALFELAGAASVRHWMEQLRQTGSFSVDAETFARLSDLFAGGFVSNSETLRTIARVHGEEGYLLDPHSAVAWRLAETMREDRALVVVGTAHWAKFGADVLRALEGRQPDDPLPVGLLEHPGKMLAKILELAPGESVPRALSDLEGRPVRFDETIAGTAEAVEAAVARSLG